MKQAKRLLALLLVVAMTMSYAVMGVSAEAPEETPVQTETVQPLADKAGEEPAEKPADAEEETPAEEEEEIPAEEEPEEEDHTPFLSFRWVDNSGDGWYVPDLDENDEWAIQHNGWTDFQMAVSEHDERWLIFYMNYYDEDAQQWKHEPVEVTADDRYLTLTKVTDIEGNSIMPGQPGDYMYRVTANEAGWDKEVEITGSYGDMTSSVMVYIQRNNCSFYTGTTMSNSTYLPKFFGDPFAEEYVFYFGVQDSDWTLKANSAYLDESSSGYDEFGQYVTLNYLNNGMYKITLDPAMYRNNPYWVDYELRIRFTVVNREDSSWEEEWDCAIWCHSTEIPNSYGIEINGIGYQFFQGTDLVLYYDAELDRDVLRPASEVLPEGVSFDLESATLTLNNANLTRLGAWNRYDNWEYDEETQQDVWVSYGYNFPNGLTIKLVGENTITSTTDTPLNLGEELDVTITGDGSLLVKAVNSEENIRTGWWGIDGEDVEREVHYGFDAGSLNNNSTLTIAGNADVTFEVEGTAINEWYDEESGEFKTENAFLSALRGSQGSLTVKDSATLTTKLPEDAKTNGPVVYADDVDPNEDPWNYQTPGGYRGLEEFNSITVQDNATVNTTTLYVHDWYEWDGEKEILVKDSTLTVSGGTLNIAALGSYNRTEAWEWNEETQQDEYLGIIDHSHYEGLYNSNGTITVSGGQLNITITATEEELAGSTWGRAICLEGDNPVLNITGGEVNVTANAGAALELNGWYDEESGKEYRSALNVSGGIVNLNASMPMNVTPYGDVSISGGQLNASGDIHLGWDGENSSEPRAAASFAISGGEVNLKNGNLFIENQGNGLTMTAGTLNMTNGGLHINTSASFSGGEVNLTNVEVYVNGHLDDHGNVVGDKVVLAIDGADVTVNDTTPTADDEYPVAMRINRGTALEITGGSLTINTKGYCCALEVNGDYTQTGGTVAIDARNGDLVVRGAMNCAGLTTVSGGTLNIFAETNMAYWHGYDSGSESEEDEWYWVGNPNTGLTVSGDAVVNATSGRAYYAVVLLVPAEFTGGSVNATVIAGVEASWKDDLVTENTPCISTTAIGVYDNGTEEVKSGLTISGGTHSMTVPTNENIHASIGICVSAELELNITGGKCTVHADMALYSEGLTQEAPFNLTGVKMFAVDDRHEMTIRNSSYQGFTYELDENGELIRDENGDPVTREITVYNSRSVCKVCDPFTIPRDVVIAATECEALGHNMENHVCLTCGYVDGIAAGTCGENLTWVLADDGTLTISGEGAMEDFSYAGAPWYSYRTSITSVVIESGVTSIGNFAFEDCANLTGVTIGNGVTAIGDDAFNGCTSLTSVTIPDGVTSIGMSAFRSCYGLTNVTIGKGVTTIGYGAFAACFGLTDVTIGSSVTVIGSSAFNSCTSLKTVTISDSVTSIGDQAFESCGSLTTVAMGNSVTSIGYRAFSGCTSLTTVTIPASVTSIGGDAFESTPYLESITDEKGFAIINGILIEYSGDGGDVEIPDSVTSIGYGAFWSCSGLTGVTIPNSVTSIGDWAFCNCTSLTSITFMGDAPTIEPYAYETITATVYYPANNDTWTEDVMQDYGGTITWVAVELRDGWVQEDGIWYYYQNGSALTGWLRSGSTWYYLTPSGAMATGWKQVGSTWYYFNASGAMQTGWLRSGSTWYYLTPGGAMATGWQQVGSTWYYFNASGVMVTGWQQIGGAWYYFNSSGVMQTGWLQSGSAWYYLTPGGAMATGWQQVGNTWYYFNSSGVMQTGWLQSGNTWYYLAPSGAMVTGWLQLGNNWYYMNSSGAMVTGSQVINGKTYYFGSNGVWIG